MVIDKQQMRKYKKIERPLKVLGFENGIILPLTNTDNVFPFWKLGGVCDSNNQFVHESFYDGGYYEWKEEYCSEECAIYIGLFFQHWGHFLVDLTGRLWAVRNICAQKPEVRISYVGNQEPDGNYLRFFELLGVRKEQLLRISKPTRFKRVFLPEISFRSCDWYSDEFIKMFNSMSEVSLYPGDVFQGLTKDKKIYFTRTRLYKARRSESGEKFFENVFRDNGYIVLAPEKLSLDEQIYIWNNAKEIVCINGSILLNVIFCNNSDLLITVLNKTSIYHENPDIFLEARGLSAKYLDVYNEPLKKYPRSLGQGPFLLKDTKEFKDYCDANGLRHKKGLRVHAYFLLSKLKFSFHIIALNPVVSKILQKLEFAIHIIAKNPVIKIIKINITNGICRQKRN